MNASVRSSKSHLYHAAPVLKILHLSRDDNPILLRRNAMRFAVLCLAIFVSTLAQGVAAPSEELVLIRLKYTVDHSSHYNDWNAKGFARVLHNVSEALRRATSVKTAKVPKTLTLEDPDIFSCPFIFMIGHYSPIFNKKEIVNLREHLTKGGFILATSCCGNDSFTKGFEREMKKVFPNKELKLLPPEHPVFSTFYTIENVRCLFGISEDNKKIKPPPIRGIDIEGRTVVILSPYALSCGWTRRSTCIKSCRRFETEDAFKIGINTIIYALTH